MRAHERLPATPGATPAARRPATHDVLSLQRTAGNRAVLARLVVNTGLKGKTKTDAFAKAARDWWADPANKAKSLKDYGDFLIGKANAALRAMGSYEVKPNYVTTGSASGTFSRVNWDMTINTTKF
ncbi:MAG TPA: hypothetical protein VH418_08320, partial [Solirubrobacteraceae bacterium]